MLQNFLVLFEFADVLGIFKNLADSSTVCFVSMLTQVVDFEMDFEKVQLQLVELLLAIITIVDRLGCQVQ